MKKYKNGKRVLSAAIALALVFSMSVISLADDVLGGGEPTVVFTADRSFAFSDPNDLFDGFKDMMPGDSLSREVTVTSEASGRYDIYLYARDCVLYNDEVNGQGHFEGVDAENTSEILDAVTVTDSQGNVLDLRAAGPAEEGVYLGRFSRGDSMKLTVSLSLPIGMGNEYQDAEAYIDWIFYAKQYTSPDDGGGDDDTYTVTVNYYDMDGNELRSSYVRSYAEGTRYNVESVIYETLRSGGESYVLMSIEGDEVEGYMNDDRVIDLYYSLDEDIDDGDTPLEELPDIDDGNNPPDITDIDENLPPLSNLPDTGDNGILYSAVAMVLSGTALAALLLFAPRKKNEAE